jgi:uncharacterized membrane protein required for colicin V production
MSPQLQQASGSPIWQLVFVSFAIVLIVFEILRGWRRGIARQIARLGALIAAYFAAFLGGDLIVPMLRPFFKIPDVVLSVLAGGTLAFVLYAIVNSLGTILFRRTREHDSAVVRFVYGVGGAVLGLFFGAFLVWIVVFAVRSTGAVADAQMREHSAESHNGGGPQVIHAVDVRGRFLSRSDEESTSLSALLARLKNSLEMGVIGDAVKRSDVVPIKTYDALGKLGQVASNWQNAERFLAYPGARDLSEHPKIVALLNDREISEMIAQGRLVDLLQNQKIIDAANDPAIIEQIKKFDLQRALDYAVQPESVEASKR